MSVIRVVTVCCDDCGEEFDGAEPYLSLVRVAARKAGWLSTPSQDVCPECLRLHR